MSKIDHTTMDKYVDGVLIKEGKKETDKAFEVGQYWWKKSGTEMAQSIAASIKFMQTHQPTRSERLIANSRLYGSSNPFNLIGPALSKTASSSTNTSGRVSFNLCQSVVDTLTSKIAKNKVTPSFITSGGVWGMQKKAENLSKFVEGLFYECDVHVKGVNNFRDGSVWGTGIAHVFEEEDEVKVERAFPHEFVVDQLEAIAGKPRQLHRVKIVDRALLLELFRDDEEAIKAIETASQSTYIEVGAEGTAADLVTVTESWHLRSGKDCDDGVHAICLGNQLLTSEDELSYEKDYFPFAFFNYSDPLIGFWGQGACERLSPLQLEINRLMLLDQKSRWMMASFKILVENGSKIVAQHLSNDIGSIIHYSGTPPQYITPPPIDPSNETKLDSLIAKGYQQEGVSQLEAASVKPLGIDSGRALREFNNIADDRMMFVSQRMEKFYIEIARQAIEVVKDIYKRKKTYKVMFPTTRFLETIDWKDINLKDDEYILKAFPTSSLPDEPSAKLQTIQEYMQAGLISPRSGRRLMSMPDVEMSDKLANAAEELICKIIEDMLDEENEDWVYEAPEPEFDLVLGKQLCIEYYNYAKLNNCPQKLLARLRQFQSQIDDLLGVNAPQPMVQASPMAAPMPAPTSNMVPNIAAVQ